MIVRIARAKVGHRQAPLKAQRPTSVGRLLFGCLTMTYFRMGTPHYHRRATVSRSCSGWEGVVPAGYGRQALKMEGKDWVGCYLLLAHRHTVMRSSRTGH